jgi:predicted nucleic acid-binding protein
MKNDTPERSRIFLDSSVLIAGAASRTGASRAILMLTEIGFLNLVVSQQVLEEVERNLTEKLPRALAYYNEVVLSLDLKVLENPNPADVEACKAIIQHADDAPILAAAMMAQPSRFITLKTKHFIDDPRVPEASGLNIETPGELVRELRHWIEEGLSSNGESTL